MRWYQHPVFSWRSLFYGYPFGVYLLSRAHLTAFAVALAACGALAQIDLSSRRKVLMQLLGVAAVVLAVVAVKPAALPRIYPFLISVSFMTVFWRSLGMEASMLEVYASKMKALEPEDRVVLRQLTKWWVVFLGCNSLVLLTLIFYFSLETWLLYSGLLSYLLIGAMAGLTTLVAKRRAAGRAKARLAALTAAILLSFGLSALAAPENARAESAAPLEAKLKERYGVITKMTADLVQTKTSPHLFKPLVSTVRLKYAPDEITWTMLEPVASEVVLTKNGITMRQGGAGAPATALPLTQNPKVQAMMVMIRALFALDFKTLAAGYDLDMTGGGLVLHATAKKGTDEQLIRSLTFQFAPDLTPLKLDLTTAADETDLVFSNVKMQR